MRRVYDGKENDPNRGDPAGGLICHSNNELQEVSRGHSSVESRGNPEGAKARTVNCWSKNPIVGDTDSTSREGCITPSACHLRKGRRNNACRTKN